MFDFMIIHLDRILLSIANMRAHCFFVKIFTFSFVYHCRFRHSDIKALNALSQVYLLAHSWEWITI